MSLPAVDDEEESEDPAGLIGRILVDRYRVTGLVGVGGIGRVYRAEHLVLKRPVALKVLLEHYQCVPDLQRRFEREAMALAALSHPNIVTITDFVSSRDATFLVMELIQGRDLDDILDRDGALPPADALSVMEQVLSSLAYAHERDVIHRDLKPQNVLVQELPGGRLHPTILDFGLAKFMDGSGPSANLTKTGLIVGTPAYMAPEQASGAHADKRADVYAAGIMLFELLAGVHPFEGFEGAELLRQHLLAPAPTLASACPDSRVAPELEVLLSRALAKDGADRYADGAAMLEALLALPENAFVPGEPSTGKKRMQSSAPTAVGSVRAAVPAAFGGRRAPKRDRALIAMALVAVISVVALLAVLIGSAGSTPPAASTPSSEAPEAHSSEATAEPSRAEAPADDGASAEGAAAQGAVAEGAADAETATAEADENLDAPLAEDEADQSDDAIPPPVVRPGARNPWRGSTPAALNRVRRRVTRGNPITKAQVRQVAQYRREHPTDVRATLLLAQVYMSRGWFSNALSQYERAYRRDPSARGDRQMLRDIVRMVGTDVVHQDATDALVEMYGAEAASAVRAAAGRADGETRARLDAALARLR